MWKLNLFAQMKATKIYENSNKVQTSPENVSGEVHCIQSNYQIIKFFSGISPNKITKTKKQEICMFDQVL